MKLSALALASVLLGSICFQPAISHAQEKWYYDGQFDDPEFYVYEDIETVAYARIGTGYFYSQRQQNWCWAATLSTVAYLMRNVSYDPCQIASDNFAYNCCSNPNPCNQPLSLGRFDPLLRPLGIRAEVIEGRISWSMIREELDQGRPITILVNGGLAVGHYITIVGYDMVRNTRLDETRRSVVIHDPMFGYYIGEPRDMGYRVTWNDLLNGYFKDFEADWINTVLYH